MSTAIQQLLLGGEVPWKGLYDRRGNQLEDPAYFLTAAEAELVGGVLSKRLGTGPITGQSGITNGVSTTTVLTTDTGPAGARVSPGDTIRVWLTVDRTLFAAFETRIVAGAGVTNTTITLTVALSSIPPVGAPWLVLKPLPGRVNGLFLAVFRDRHQRLLAQAATDVYSLEPNTSAALVEHYPKTTTKAGWSTTTGALVSVQGLEVGDWVYVPSVSGNKVARVTSLTTATGTIVVSPAFGASPGTGVDVFFMPPRQASDTHFAQYANETHIAQVQPTNAPTTAAPIPPTKFNQTIITTLATDGLYRHGIKPPVQGETTALFTAAAQAPAAAGITGIFTYRVKYRCSFTGQESEPGPLSNLTAPAAQDVNLTNIPISVDPQVDKKRIYRTTNGGAGVWFFLAEIANATTTYLDSTTDATLSSAQMREFLDVAIPDTVSVITPWTQANRLVAIDGAGRQLDPQTGVETFVPRFLRYSDQPDIATGQLKGESWPADNTIFIGYDDGDVIVGVQSFFDALLVFKERSIWRVTGIPPNLTIEPVVYRPDQTGVGALSQKAIALGENELYVTFADGVYLLDRYMGVQSGLQGRLLSRAIDERFADMSFSLRALTHAVYHRQRRRFLLWFPREGELGTQKLTVGRMYYADSGPRGEPAGWTEHTYLAPADAGGSEVKDITASCVARVGLAGPITTRYAGGADVVFVGSETGHVVQLDVAGGFLEAEEGEGDWLLLPVFFNLITLPASFTGRGQPARVRAIDLVHLRIVSPATVVPDVLADYAAAAGNITACSFDNGLTPLEERLVFLTKGRKLSIRVTDGSYVMDWQLKQLGVSFQRLPWAAGPSPLKQSPVAYPA